MPDSKTAHEHPFPGNVLMHVDRMDEYSDETRTPVDDPNAANVVSSNYGTVHSTMHRPVLDIDFPAALVPSSTPGHFHLYLDKPLPWEQYKRVLQVLGDVGILEPGYVNVSVERRHTAVRVPWIRKGDQDIGSLLGYGVTTARAMINMALSAVRG